MSIPDAGDASGVSLDEIYAWFHEFLGRDPDFITEAQPRVGNGRTSTYYSIRCSQEAANYRENHGAEPDLWCATHNENGWPIQVPTKPPPVNVPPPAVVLPPIPSFPGLDGAVRFLLDALGQQIGSIIKQVQTVHDNVQAQLGALVDKALPALLKAEQKIQDQLGQTVHDLVPNVLQMVGQALGGVESLLTAFVNNAADVVDVAGAFTGEIKKESESLFSWAGDLGQQVFKMGIAGFLEHLEGEAPEVIDQMVAHMESSEHLPSEVRNILNAMKSRQRPVNFLLGIGIALAVFHEAALAIAAPDIEAVSRGAWEKQPTKELPAEVWASLAIKGMQTYEAAVQHGFQTGIDSDRFQAIIANMRAWPTPDEVMSAFFRGAITPEYRDELLEKNGFDDRTRDLHKAIRVNIPTVQDVLTFLRRDVFIPEFVEAFGMDLEYPADADEWAAKLGIPHEIMMLHWRSHWDLPSITQAFEMFQRSKITETDLRRLLRAQGVEPYWRDPIIAISYNPPGRIDLRRMQKFGLLNHEQLVRRYRDIGYSPDDAELIAEFTEKINHKEKKTEVTDLNIPLRNHIITALMKGTITEEDARTYLRGLSFDNDEITAFITEARLIRVDARAERIAELTGDLYKKDERTKLEVTTKLRERGFIDSEIAQKFIEWDLEKELHPIKSHEQKARDLTESELMQAYTDKIMTEAEVRAGLKKLRFPPANIDVLIRIHDYKIAKAEQTDKIEVVHQKVLKGTMDENAAASALDTIGTRTAHRDALIAKWMHEHRAKTLDLPMATVGELFKKSIWDGPKSRTYLIRIGLDQEETDGLLKLWGEQSKEAGVRESARTKRETLAQKREADRLAAIEAKKHKELIRSEITAALKGSVIDEAEAMRRLLREHYDQVEAQIVIDTALKRPKV